MDHTWEYRDAGEETRLVHMPDGSWLPLPRGSIDIDLIAKLRGIDPDHWTHARLADLFESTRTAVSQRISRARRARPDRPVELPWDLPLWARESPLGRFCVTDVLIRRGELGRVSKTDRVNYDRTMATLSEHGLVLYFYAGSWRWRPRVPGDGQEPFVRR